MIIPENHTRNKFYLKSLNTLVELIKKSGYEVCVGRIGDKESFIQDEKKFIRKNDYLIFGNYNPDIIILNNDLSDGVPTILNSIKQPILPDKNMGWSNRSKTIHFDYYSDIVNSFSRILDIDAWLLVSLLALKQYNLYGYHYSSIRCTDTSLHNRFVHCSK